MQNLSRFFFETILSEKICLIQRSMFRHHMKINIFTKLILLAYFLIFNGTPRFDWLAVSFVWQRHVTLLHKDVNNISGGIAIKQIHINLHCLDGTTPLIWKKISVLVKTWIVFLPDDDITPISFIMYFVKKMASSFITPKLFHVIRLLKCVCICIK